MSQSGGSAAKSAAGLATLVKKFQNRWFLVRNLRSKNDLVLRRPRWAMSYLRGPLTPIELRRVRERLTKRDATKDVDVAVPVTSVAHQPPSTTTSPP